MSCIHIYIYVYSLYIHIYRERESVYTYIYIVCTYIHTYIYILYIHVYTHTHIYIYYIYICLYLVCANPLLQASSSCGACVNPRLGDRAQQGRGQNSMETCGNPTSTIPRSNLSRNPFSFVNTLVWTYAQKFARHRVHIFLNAGKRVCSVRTSARHGKKKNHQILTFPMGSWRLISPKKHLYIMIEINPAISG